MDYKRVRDESWDYAKADTKEFTHGLHTYPAMMIPQVARRLLNEYGANCKSLLDPFMGSGSTLVEGILRPSIKELWGIEINPLAILIAEVKLTPIEKTKLEKSFQNLMNKIKSEAKKKSSKSKQATILQNIDFWFKPKTIAELSVIKKRIEEEKDKSIKNFFKVCFSETARKVSMTRSWEYKLYRIPADLIESYNPDTFETFKKVTADNIIKLGTLTETLKNKHFEKPHLIKGDTRTKNEGIPENSCDILVTSPPYGDSRTTVAYGQFSRLGSQWLGYDYEEVKRVDKKGLGGVPASDFSNNLKSETLSEVISEIGAKDEERAKDVLSFYNDLDKCIYEIDRVMKTGSCLCFVVGNRTVKEINIPTDKIITELFCNRKNYLHHKTIVRAIPSKRMPRVNSPTNVAGKTVTTMNEEFIVILKKK